MEFSRFFSAYRLTKALAGDPPISEVTWPLKRLHEMMQELEGPNDGLVSVASARAFGIPLDDWPADHLRQMNWMTLPVEPSVCPPIPELYARILSNLADLGFGAGLARAARALTRRDAG